MKRKLLFNVTKVLTTLITLTMLNNQNVNAQATIDPNVQGQLIDVLFYDVKYGHRISEERAHELFSPDQDDHNGMRISIFGTDEKPAHPSPGEVDGSYYNQTVNNINRAKAERSDLKIFASKKLRGKNSFPDWTKNSKGVIPEQYAILLADFIEHMNSRGVTIDYLGIDNERYFNEGNIGPSKHAAIVDELRNLSQTRGFNMPQIVGHDDYFPGRNSWMQKLIDKNLGDRLDIYGTHYYPKHRNHYKELWEENTLAGNRIKWQTEGHWDGKDANDFDEAEQALCAIWDCLDLDGRMNGLIWWDYGVIDKPYRNSLMKYTTVPLKDSRPIYMTDDDGYQNVIGQLQTRAFREGNLITVFAVSTSGNTNYQFNLANGTIDGDVSYRQWVGTDPNSTTGTLNADGNRSYTLTLPARSVSVFSFQYSPASTVSGNYIEVRGFSGLRLHVNSNGEVDMTSETTADARWLNEDMSGNYFSLRNLDNLYKLHSSDEEFVDVTSPIWYGKNVQWELVESPRSGWFHIKHRGSGRYLKYDGQTVHLADTDNKGSRTRWRIIDANESTLKSGLTKQYESFDKHTTLEIYPNPAQSELNVSGTEDGTMLHIYNTQGSLMVSTKERVIDINDFPSGLYIIKVNGENYKFLKN